MNISLANTGPDAKLVMSVNHIHLQQLRKLLEVAGLTLTTTTTIDLDYCQNSEAKEHKYQYEHQPLTKSEHETNATA